MPPPVKIQWPCPMLLLPLLLSPAFLFRLRLVSKRSIAAAISRDGFGNRRVPAGSLLSRRHSRAAHRQKRAAANTKAQYQIELFLQQRLLHGTDLV